MGIIIFLAAGTLATPVLFGIFLKLLVDAILTSYTGRGSNFFVSFIYYAALVIIAWFAQPVFEQLLIGTPPYAVAEKPFSQFVMLSPLILIVVLLYFIMRFLVRGLAHLRKK